MSDSIDSPPEIRQPFFSVDKGFQRHFCEIVNASLYDPSCVARAIMGQNERNLRFVGSMPHGSSALFHPTPFYPANQKHIAPAIAATSIQSLLLREVEAGLGLAGLVSMWASAQQTASILLTSPEGAVLRLIGL